MDMPTCANDVAGMASITSPNNNERMESLVRTLIFLLPDHPSLTQSCFVASGCVD
jgi:hypothetical protein